MNIKDSKTASEIRDKVDSSKASLEEHKVVIDEVGATQREKFESLSDKMQETAKGLNIESDAQTLESIADALQQAIDALEEVIVEFGNLEP